MPGTERNVSLGSEVGCLSVARGKGELGTFACGI